MFHKVSYDGGSLPKVWITNKFLNLDRKTQNNFLSVVYADYNIANDDFGIAENVMFRDSLIRKSSTGKRIAKYDPFDGISNY